MFIQNAVYKAVPTDGLTFPLAEGTVITVGDVTGIVPENIALAAPTGLIYLATGGTIDLTSEANAGVTFTDEQLNELGGDFNFIPLTENGASSLPSYTSADIGKVLSLGETIYTIIPAQTIALANGYGTVTGADFSHLNVGEQITFTGTAYGQTLSMTGSVEEVDGEKRITFGNDYFKSNGEVYIEEMASVASATVEANEVLKTDRVQTVIVPEQTKNVRGSTPTPVEGDASGFVEGASYVMHVNGNEYTGTFSIVSGNVAAQATVDGLSFLLTVIDGSVSCTTSGPTDASVEYTFSLAASAPKAEPKFAWANILYQFEIGKTTPQDIINAVKAGKLVVMGTQTAAYGWGEGLSILMAQYEYSTDTYGVRFIGINSGGNGVSVKGDNLQADGLNSAYEAGST